MQTSLHQKCVNALFSCEVLSTSVRQCACVVRFIRCIVFVSSVETCNIV